MILELVEEGIKKPDWDQDSAVRGKTKLRVFMGGGKCRCRKLHENQAREAALWRARRDGDWRLAAAVFQGLGECQCVVQPPDRLLAWDICWV